MNCDFWLKSGVANQVELRKVAHVAITDVHAIVSHDVTNNIRHDKTIINNEINSNYIVGSWIDWNRSSNHHVSLFWPHNIDNNIFLF